MIAVAALRQLSTVTPGRAQLRAALEVAVIIALVTVQERWLAWPTAPFVALLIASRQHALLVLMHDAAHYRAARTRWVNELFGEALGFSLFVSMRGYRRHHHKHHVAEALNTTADPDFERKLRRAPADWSFPMPRRHLVRLLVRDVLLLNTKEYVYEAEDAKNLEAGDRAYHAIRLLLALATFAVITLTSGWRVYLLYWILPAFTWLKAILRLRSVSDHFGLKDGEGAVGRTRTILAPWWERLLIAPMNIGVHGPHHAFTAVPYYRLRALHEKLMQDERYRQTCTVSPSYFATVTRELSR